MCARVCFLEFLLFDDDWRGPNLSRENEKEEREREKWIESNIYIYIQCIKDNGGKFRSLVENGGNTEEHGCNFFAVRLRALGFDECCVIECNHNNVLFGMLSKVHRCINKMHLILNGQTGERNSLPML